MRQHGNILVDDRSSFRFDISIALCVVISVGVVLSDISRPLQAPLALRMSFALRKVQSNVLCKARSFATCKLQVGHVRRVRRVGLRFLLKPAKNKAPCQWLNYQQGAIHSALALPLARCKAPCQCHSAKHHQKANFQHSQCPTRLTRRTRPTSSLQVAKHLRKQSHTLAIIQARSTHHIPPSSMTKTKRRMTVFPGVGKRFPCAPFSILL